jgi:hypothetical protein
MSSARCPIRHRADQLPTICDILSSMVEIDTISVQAADAHTVVNATKHALEHGAFNDLSFPDLHNVTTAMLNILSSLRGIKDHVHPVNTPSGVAGGP